MKIETRKLLFVGPHPDDVELGCAGVIARFSGRNEIKYLILSPCTEEPRNKNIIDEAQNAIKHLGLNGENLVVKDIPRRIFGEHRTSIREILISIRDSFKPELVFCPSLRDLHQDHGVTADESLRLFRDVNVLSYEAIRSSIFFQPNLYIKLSSGNLDSKIKAIMSYESQFDRYYFKPGALRSLASMRGNQARVEYAEAFEILRMII